METVQLVEHVGAMTGFVEQAGGMTGFVEHAGAMTGFVGYVAVTCPAWFVRRDRTMPPTVQSRPQ
ncbi:MULTISPECIES: hypothetical protein [unclassified Mycobacterium]|uniref:hypothetical protein n=1 Tax=unclassified Mycobacterium TaxID=2642494 RepID=UPI002741429D|nr:MULTISPECIES: hypothetical protein [unclassified Mycobacterium]MDP7701928.1 hypothetical protein [Mycobacterium sp. TY815]MDP7724778.1 hypothetical protein [Mycobacterium sp. TY814]